MNIGPSTAHSAALTNSVTTSREDAAARREEARMKSASTALEALKTLKQRRSTTNEDAKAAAQQKVERLKSRIRMLQMMATTDPKGTARLAAQLARELGAAVKAYAAAGGNTAGMSSTAAAPQAVGGEAAADPAANADPAAAASADAVTPVPAEPAPNVEGEEAATGPGSDDKAEARPNPYQKAIDAAQADLAERSRNAAERRADQEFMTEAKRLANELKSAVRRAAEALKRTGEADAPEQDDAEKAIREVEREIQSHEQAMPDATAGIGISITV